MPENILIAIAWPYANAEIHVENITGSHLPGDIVARFHRLKGDDVLMVSNGSPWHACHHSGGCAWQAGGGSLQGLPQRIRGLVSEDRHPIRSIHNHAYRKPFQGCTGYFSGTAKEWISVHS
jgi:hypothetical protein